MIRTLAAMALAGLLSLASQSSAHAQGCDEPTSYFPPSSYVASGWAWTVWPVAPLVFNAYARAYPSSVSGWATARWYDVNTGKATFPPGPFWWRVRARCYDRQLRNGVWCASIWLPPDADGGGNPPRPPDAHWKCPASHPVITGTAHVQVSGPPGIVYYYQ